MESRTEPNDSGEGDIPDELEDDFWESGSAVSALKVSKRRSKRRTNEGLTRPTTRNERKKSMRSSLLPSRSEENASSERRNGESGRHGEDWRATSLYDVKTRLTSAVSTTRSSEEGEPVFHDEAFLESLLFISRETAPPEQEAGLFHDDRLVAPTQLRRQQRCGPSPGAVYVDRDGSHRRVPEEDFDSIASSTSCRDSDAAGDVLVQAQLVRMNSNVLVTATPDPWWRRHQWWLAGATAIAIVLVVVLSTVDLGGSKTVEPILTMAPTSPSILIALPGSLEPTVAPTMAPTMVPTMDPTMDPTMVPTMAPTMAPSVLISVGSCSPFSSIAAMGSRLGISSHDNNLEVVTLPFLFNWRGEVAYARVTVLANGMVFPGVDGRDDGCCGPDPITIAERYNVPRIAVAQADLAAGGAIYTTQLENAFIISWEDVYGYNAAPEHSVNFQVLLFENGDVELRWGDGNPIIGQFAAGLEDDPAGVIIPATGSPFDGVYGAGISRQWPANQCRVFVASNGGYTEAIV